MNRNSAYLEVISGHIPFTENFGQLITHSDARGDLAELYRREWPGIPELRQWNFARNGPNVMRGMHVHPIHADYIIVLEGEILLGLHDIRPDSPSYGCSGIVKLTGERLTWSYIHPGIVHGFYTRNGNSMVYGLTKEWDTDDEIGCQWNDPDLKLDWPDIDNPVLSERDRLSGSFKELVLEYQESIKHEG